MLKNLTARKDIGHPAAGAGVPSVVIRTAGPADADALERLAQLDSSRTPRGDVLIGQVGDELWAALSLEDGHAVADPLRPSSELLWLLIERARQMRRAHSDSVRSWASLFAWGPRPGRA